MGNPTSRRYSSYNTCPLPTLADKLLFMLTYLKQNPIQEVQGQLFGMSQIKCEQMDSLTASRIESSLSRPRTAASPNRCSVCRDVQDARSGGKLHHPPFWHDGTERPIHRPTDSEEQQEYYSGKKKCHTLKNLLVITETCHVCFLSHTSEGKTSDKSLAELAGYTLPAGSCLYQDKGFQGFYLQDVTLVQPKKKPPGGELTPPEQATNRRISSIRIRIATRHWWGKTLQDRQGQNPSSEGRDT